MSGHSTLDAAGHRRLGAYTYLTGQADTPTYLAIMRVFAQSLVTDALAQATPTATDIIGSAPDTDIVCTFHRRPGVTTRIQSQIGDLTIVDGTITISAANADSADIHDAQIGAPA